MQHDEFFNQIIKGMSSGWTEIGSQKTSLWEENHDGDVAGLLPLPLSLGGGGEATLKSTNRDVAPGVYNGYVHSLPNQQHFNEAPVGSMVGAPSTCGVGQTTSASTASASAPPRQRVRARRGQATDPHSIAERLRRERIAERMKALQELVPNANKTDKASMLDEIIDYVKFLQLQVKVLSMSRLGGAAAVAPLVTDMSSEGRVGVHVAANSDSLTVTEHQVAKLMEDDMGSAMQYLQGKGLCLMPISLASAISTATCRPSLKPNLLPLPPNSIAIATGDGAPSSPNMSVLTAQSAMNNGANNIDADGSRSTAGKDS